MLGQSKIIIWRTYTSKQSPTKIKLPYNANLIVRMASAFSHHLLSFIGIIPLQITATVLSIIDTRFPQPFPWFHCQVQSVFMFVFDAARLVGKGGSTCLGFYYGTITSLLDMMLASSSRDFTALANLRVYLSWIASLAFSKTFYVLWCLTACVCLSACFMDINIPQNSHHTSDDSKSIMSVKWAAPCFVLLP